MGELLRRVAALAATSALGIALLAPLGARAGALPAEHVTAVELLDAARLTPRLDADRGDAGRNASAAYTLLALTIPLPGERMGPRAALPTPATVAMSAELRAVTTPRPAPSAVTPPAGGGTVTGKATWYCCTAGYRGQAVVALPGALGGRFDPSPSRFVTVCADRCARLPVVDYCGCHWGTAQQKVADLSPEAWAAVTDRSRGLGVVTVTIHLAG